MNDHERIPNRKAKFVFTFEDGSTLSGDSIVSFAKVTEHEPWYTVIQDAGLQKIPKFWMEFQGITIDNPAEFNPGPPATNTG
jgi:hypothetical protein